MENICYQLTSVGMQHTAEPLVLLIYCPSTATNFYEQKMNSECGNKRQ